MKISLEKDLAEELITYKLRNIQNLIYKILERWNEESPDNFIEKARNGTYSEAENDAIDLRQLLIEEEKLKKLLENLES